VTHFHLDDKHKARLQAGLRTLIPLVSGAALESEPKGQALANIHDMLSLIDALQPVKDTPPPTEE
jgi:hypothetical protein